MPRALDRLRHDARATASTGWSLLAELISAIGVWTAIGFGLDKLFGTAPVLVAVGALVGHAMAVYIAFWRTGQMSAGNRRSSA